MDALIHLKSGVAEEELMRRKVRMVPKRQSCSHFNRGNMQ